MNVDKRSNLFQVAVGVQEASKYKTLRREKYWR
jgi:hypothetical protein